MARAATTTDAFNALGDRSRRDILALLARGEASVGELVDELEMAQPLVSKHLRVLRDVDLVTCRHDGRRRHYRLNRLGLRPVESWLERLTADVNDHFDRLDDHLDLMQRHPEQRGD